jgi:hypothetical protein
MAKGVKEDESHGSMALVRRIGLLEFASEKGMKELNDGFHSVRPVTV